MHPIPYPILTGEYQSYVVRAHRMRSAVAFAVIREVVRWISGAAR